MAGPKAFGGNYRYSNPNVNPPASAVRIFGQLVGTDPTSGAFAGTFDASETGGLDPAILPIQAGLLAAGALPYGIDLTDGFLYRGRSAGDDEDNQTPVANGAALVLARSYLYDGAAWDRQRSAGAAALASLSAQGALLVAAPGQWSVNHVPAAAAQATASRAAGAAGVRNICVTIDATLIIPPTVNQPAIQLNLRDGATGAGTILWSRQFGVGAALAAGGQMVVSLSGLNIVGSAATAMTLEFSAAGAATTLQSVAMTGYLAQ